MSAEDSLPGRYLHYIYGVNKLTSSSVKLRKWQKTNNNRKHKAST